MNWLNRILVLMLILCLSRTPVPWGHSHSGMDAGQLALHLQKYHPATGKDELPKGWHWHVTHIELSADGETGKYPVAVLEESVGKTLTAPTPDTTHIGLTPLIVTFDSSTSAEVASAHAVFQQQTYLRLNVLLI